MRDLFSGCAYEGTYVAGFEENKSSKVESTYWRIFTGQILFFWLPLNQHSRLCPRERKIELQATESWAGPGNEAGSAHNFWTLAPRAPCTRMRNATLAHCAARGMRTPSKYREHCRFWLCTYQCYTGPTINSQYKISNSCGALHQSKCQSIVQSMSPAQQSLESRIQLLQLPPSTTAKFTMSRP